MVFAPARQHENCASVYYQYSNWHFYHRTAHRMENGTRETSSCDQQLQIRRVSVKCTGTLLKRGKTLYKIHPNLVR